tara:strand:+ start:365 stop:562 length:198 start_codon:yes stop_codon:yes gene_type:complete
MTTRHPRTEFQRVFEKRTDWLIEMCIQGFYQVCTNHPFQSQWKAIAFHGFGEEVMRQDLLDALSR